jgi:hypothetical protein
MLMRSVNTRKLSDACYFGGANGGGSRGPSGEAIDPAAFAAQRSGGGSSSRSTAARISSVSSSSTSVFSLALFCVEVAAGGCSLGLYLAFPSLLPAPLLQAAYGSCEALLGQVGAGVACKDM